MKRSEMVDIFDLSYDEWEHDSYVWKRFDSYGDYLVHLAIEAGMLPPSIDLGIRNTYGEIEFFNEWEEK